MQRCSDAAPRTNCYATARWAEPAHQCAPRNAARSKIVQRAKKYGGFDFRVRNLSKSLKAQDVLHPDHAPPPSKTDTPFTVILARFHEIRV
eukprot:6455807-Prymnesium_polylepis.1